MTDKISKENRSKTMKAIKSQSRLENAVSKELWKRGYRFRKNVKKLFGTPDIAIKKYKIVIFIDSCFWHFCPIHGHMPKSNLEYWENKLQKNIERDQKVSEYYTNIGWHIKRVWEHEINQDFEETIDNIINFIENARNVK